MIPDWLKQNLELLVKPSVPFLFVLAAGSLILILSPFNIRTILQLDDFYERFRWIVAPVFLTLPHSYL